MGLRKPSKQTNVKMIRHDAATETDEATRSVIVIAVVCCALKSGPFSCIGCFFSRRFHILGRIEETQGRVPPTWTPGGSQSGAPRHIQYRLPEKANGIGVLRNDVTIEALVIDRRKEKKGLNLTVSMDGDLSSQGRLLKSCEGEAWFKGSSLCRPDS